MCDLMLNVQTLECTWCPSGQAMAIDNCQLCSAHINKWCNDDPGRSMHLCDKFNWIINHAWTGLVWVYVLTSLNPWTPINPSMNTSPSCLSCQQLWNLQCDNKFTCGHTCHNTASFCIRCSRYLIFTATAAWIFLTLACVLFHWLKRPSASTFKASTLTSAATVHSVDNGRLVTRLQDTLALLGAFVVSHVSTNQCWKPCCADARESLEVASFAWRRINSGGPWHQFPLVMSAPDAAAAAALPFEFVLTLRLTNQSSAIWPNDCMVVAVIAAVSSINQVHNWNRQQPWLPWLIMQLWKLRPQQPCDDGKCILLLLMITMSCWSRVCVWQLATLM